MLTDYSPHSIKEVSKDLNDLIFGIWQLADQADRFGCRNGIQQIVILWMVRRIARRFAKVLQLTEHELEDVLHRRSAISPLQFDSNIP